MRVSTTIWLGLLLVCVVVLAGIAWTQLNGPAEEKPVMWRIGTAEVQGLELRHRSGVERQFSRTTEGWSGGDPARVNAALLLLASPEAMRRLPEASADPSVYGFDQPALMIVVSQSTRPASVIEVGDATPDGSNRYVRQAGNDAIFLVPRSWFDALMLLLPDAGDTGQ